MRLIRPGTEAADWVPLFVAARLAATVVAAWLVLWGGDSDLEIALVLYGPLSALAFARVPALRESRVAWLCDFALTLAFVIHSQDWRSPFYLMWLTSLALPATSLPLRRAVWLGTGAAVTFLLVALIGGPAPGRLQPVSSETLAIHVSLPFLLVCSVAWAAEAVRRLSRERAERERLAIEAERRRIAWELHDSAKQRLHAAHLLVSSLQGRVPEPLARTVDRASVELESAASDMDSSLAELRSPLEGRPLHEALRVRAAELADDTGAPAVVVRGRAPKLSPLVAAHVYRISTEALTNSLRHADATTIEVTLSARDGRLRVEVRDDGRGLPVERRAGANGLFAMESRAASIGAALSVSSEPGAGTVIHIDVPMGGPS
jgi:signal transduction histidine kinase